MISFNIDGIEYRVFDHIFAVSRCGKILRKYQPYTPTQRGMDTWLLDDNGLCTV